MPEYIERELAIEALSRGEGCGNVCRRAIERILAADVAPVRHGRWLHRKNGVAYCSECKIDTVEDETNYCPNCGCMMDLEG